MQQPSGQTEAEAFDKLRVPSPVEERQRVAAVQGATPNPSGIVDRRLRQDPRIDQTTEVAKDRGD